MASLFGILSTYHQIINQFSVPFPHDDPAKLAQSPMAQLFAQNGFVRVDGVFTPEEVDQMKSAMARIVDGFEPDKHPRAIFNTSEEQKHVSDRYFVDSVDKIRFFYEEGAVDDATGKLFVPKENALNKVGHALHWLDPTFRRFTFHERIKEIARLLGTQSPRVAQSMYIFKQPKLGGVVYEHVDSSYLHTKHPESLLGVWIALDLARVENGCLWFVPGSHKDCGKEAKQYEFVRNEAAFAGKEDVPLMKYEGTKPNFEGKQFVPVECDSGSLVLIHGDVVHKSANNTSEQSRHAYTFHLVDIGRDGGEWAKTNWLQETKDYTFPPLFE